MTYYIFLISYFVIIKSLSAEKILVHVVLYPCNFVIIKSVKSFTKAFVSKSFLTLRTQNRPILIPIFCLNYIHLKRVLCHSKDSSFRYMLNYIYLKRITFYLFVKHPFRYMLNYIYLKPQIIQHM